jgi:predicted permease
MGMLIAFGVVHLLDLSGQQAAMLIVFGALPPAVLNFLFAERYRQEPERVASIVLIGNLFALISLPIALSMVL